MGHRHAISDADWGRIQDLLPGRPGQTGWVANDNRLFIDAVLWVAKTGAPWPDTPDRYGPWQTVYDRFNRWRKDGTWAKSRDALLLRLDKAGVIQRDLWCFDGTINRAHTAAAGAKKKSRPAAAVGRAQGDANARATGPCAGAFAGRLWYQDAPGL